jgi:hypothetical protein
MGKAKLPGFYLGTDEKDVERGIGGLGWGEGDS